MANDGTFPHVSVLLVPLSMSLSTLGRCQLLITPFAATREREGLSSREMRVKGRTATSYDNSPRQRSEVVVYGKQ